jgi:hypothetical protein
MLGAVRYAALAARHARAGRGTILTTCSTFPAFAPPVPGKTFIRVLMANPPEFAPERLGSRGEALLRVGAEAQERNLIRDLKGTTPPRFVGELQRPFRRRGVPRYRAGLQIAHVARGRGRFVIAPAASGF